MEREILEHVKNAAWKAVQFDSKGQHRQALYYYNVAVEYLAKLDLENMSTTYDQTLSEYRERISVLEHLVNEEDQKHHIAQSLNQSELQKCKFLLNQALDADESGLKDVALKLYTDAADFGLRIKTTDSDIKSKLTNIIRLALERAEFIKGIKSEDQSDIAASLEKLPSVPETSLEIDTDIDTDAAPTTITHASSGKEGRPPLHRGSSAHLKVSGGSTSYTEEEKRVLLHTSHINDHEFVPFMNIDLRERFQYAIPFSDKDGKLQLSPKQKPDFARWCRPEELFSEPRMVKGQHVDYYSIKQTVVSDCSFVASLAVSAQYEKRFGRRLITSIIFPKRNEEPMYNPFGTTAFNLAFPTLLE